MKRYLLGVAVIAAGAAIRFMIEQLQQDALKRLTSLFNRK